MPGDAFKKVRAGQPLSIPADAWNACLDAARDVQSRQSSIGRQALLADLEPDTILVRNDTDGDRDRFDVVGLGGPVIEPDDNLAEFKNRVALSAERPAERHRGLFAVLLEAVPAGGFARALVSGVTPCRIRFPGNACRWAELEPGQFQLQSQAERGTAQILWSEDTCDETRWAVVRLSNAPEDLLDNDTCRVCVTTTLPPCGQGNCTWVWDPDAAAWFLDEDHCGQGCACHEPQHCGSDECETTTTDCTSGEPQLQPDDCPGGTTTTTTTTTTTAGPTTTTTSTTPCPTTTTTQPPSCTNCEWFCHPLYGWVQASNGCLAPYPCLACPVPATPCSGDCSSAVTACGVAPPTTTTLPPPCSGNCHWICDGLGSWIFVVGNCQGGLFGCGCGAPTFPCTECGAPTATPCVPPTTQPPPTSTTFDPCRSTPPPPTTTPNPCNSGQCVWKWSVVTDSWFPVSSDCPEGCPCAAPPYEGSACESAATGCLTPPSTTTSSTTTTSTTTSTTSTTSTTTTPPPWYCAGACEGGCFGAVCSQNPCFNCAYSGPFSSFEECEAAGCPPTTTTTTTSTTTTTPDPCQFAETGVCCEQGLCFEISCEDCVAGGGTWHEGPADCDSCGPCCE